MINTIIMGAAGRMGKRLVALVQESEGLTLSGAIEWQGHPAIGRDAGERGWIRSSRHSNSRHH